MNCSSPFVNFKLGSFDFSHAVSKAYINDNEIIINWLPSSPNNFQCVNEYGTWELKIIPGNRKFILKSIVSLKAPLKNLRFSPIILSSLTAEHLAVSGLKMGGCALYKAPVAEPSEFASYYTTVISRNGEQLLISQPLHQEHYTAVKGIFSGDEIKNFAITSEVPNYGKTEITFPDTVMQIGDGIAMLREYGDNSVETPKDFSMPPECGWNSWDYYRWTVTEEAVLQNAEFIAKDKILSQHVKRIIVDDGWQYCYGEWEANPLFPSGMEALAANLKKLGFVPGLWIAPTIVEPHCRIAQLEYDMLACSEGGQPCLCYNCMERQGFVLDPTVEKSQRFLKELFECYVKRGYGYFKLDFLAATLNAGRFADSSIPRGDIIRKVMEPICAGVDNKAVIMGCNYPFSTGNQFVYATRTGGDIHATWKNIKINTPNTAFRFWQNKRLWINDPDFALCRGVDSSNYAEKLQPCLVYCKANSPYDETFSRTFASATKSELEVLLSIVLMAAGAVNLSDDMTKLNEVGLELARKVVSAQSGEPGIALDLFENNLPSRWLQKLPHGGRALVINWGESENEFSMNFDQMPMNVTDFWQGKKISAPTSVILPPHSCKLFEW